MKKPLKTFAKNKTAVLIAAAVLVILIGVLAYLALRPTTRERAFTPPKKSHVLQTAADVSTYCSRTAGVLLCQDSAGKMTKYSLPSDIARASSIMPSRDEKRFLVIAANNPIHTTPANRVLITDAQFKTLREVPSSEVGQSSGFTWAASDQSVIYARHTKDGKKNDLVSFDVASGTSQTITQQPVDASLPFTSADGKSVFMSASTQGKPFELMTIDTKDGSIHQANTDAVTKQLTQFANYTYDPASDQLYVIGSTKNGPLMLTATYKAGVVTVNKTINDGGAYTPYSLAHNGMLFMRTKDGKVTYGTVSSDGSFVAVKYQPGRGANFGLSTAPAMTASASATLSPADFVHSYVTDPAKSISDFATNLVKPTDTCKNPSYNQVDVLAATSDNKQFSVLVAPCGSDPTPQLQFYAQSGNTYELALSSSAVPICQQLDTAKLAHQLSPQCVVSSPDVSSDDSANPVSGTVDSAGSKASTTLGDKFKGDTSGSIAQNSTTTLSVPGLSPSKALPLSTETKL